MKRLLALFLLVSGVFSTQASAQSACPYIAYGAVLTAAQWNQCFANKQDFSGSPAITSIFGTSPITASVGSTTATIGLNVGVNFNFTAAQTINLNSAPLQSAQTGTILQLGNANGVNARVEVDAYAATAHFSGVRADGTAAAPTTLQANDAITSLNAFGYNGSAFVGPQAAFRCYAAQNWTTGPAYGTYCDVAVTANGGSTLAKSVRFENDGGITVPSTVTGGDKGAGTINAAGLYVNGTAVTAGTPVTTFSAGTTGFTPSSATTGAITLAGTLVVANGGTNCSSASITCFNNITGFTAGGTTGTTSTNLVFSTSPTLVTPVLGAATGTSLALGGATLGGNALAVTGTSALQATTITTASANALAAGGNGATNPAFNVDASSASQAAGLNVKGAATGGTVAIAAIDSGSNTNLTINAKGSGTIGIGSVSTGAVTITPATTITGALTASATVAVDGCTIGSLSFCSGSSTPLTISTAGLETVANATDTTSGTTGSLNTLGGVGITKALFVGTSGTFGTQQTTRGSVVLANAAAGAYTTTLELSNSATGASTLILPVALAGSGPVVLTDAIGNGVLSWASASAASSIGVGSTGVTSASGSNEVLTTGTVSGGTGVLANVAVTGTGNIVAATSPTLVTPTLGAATATSITFSPTTGGIVGTTTNDNATAGDVGEFIDSTATISTSLTSGTAVQAATINLTAGDWDAWGCVGFNGNSTTVVNGIQVGVSATTATIPSAGTTAVSTNGAYGTTAFNAVAVNQCTGPIRVSVASTTAYYLNARIYFSGSTAQLQNAELSARRRR